MQSLLQRLGLLKETTLNDSYDYIIVGGGSAGCILANRLSANPNTQVLLLEAGKRDTNPLVSLPFGWTIIPYHKKFSWMHRIKASPAIGERRMPWPRGKVLGGSSSTNGMIYIRGQAQDYNHWADSGNSEWSWKNVLPAFKRIEDHFKGESEYHGSGGPIHVTQAEGDELGDLYIKACHQAGLPLNDDFNGATQEGVGYSQVNIKNGKRQSTSATYLKQAEQRDNLTVVTQAMVEKIRFENKRATGVEVNIVNADLKVINARKEVLLCGGTINSPQLLQLSGVGPAQLLSHHNISCVHNLAGVGENLQDHLGVMVAVEIRAPLTFKEQIKPHRLIHNLYLYLRHKSGLFSAPSAYIGAFFKSAPEVERADVQLHFGTASGTRKDDGTATIDKLTGVTSIATPMRPESRGRVQITSSNANDHPEIDANYLATPKDRADMLRVIRMQRQFFDSPALREIIGVEIRPGSHLETDDELMAYTLQHCVTNYHPVGTCKMGSDDMAVVDSQLRVHGINSLRVIDASIMPSLVSGNTNAATMMIAERAADFILQPS